MIAPSASASPAAPLRVLLVDDGSPHLPLLYQELARLGCTVLGVVDSAVQLADQVVRLEPDLIIISADSPSRDTLEGIAVMSQSAPRPTAPREDLMSQPRRSFIKRSAIAAAGMAGAQTVQSVAYAQGSDAPEKKEVRIGFIPLTDCASVVMASERDEVRREVRHQDHPHQGSELGGGARQASQRRARRGACALRPCPASCLA